MDDSAFELAGDAPVVAEAMELVHQMINTRGAAACPTWNSGEFDNLYNPLSAGIRMIESMSTSAPTGAGAWAGTCKDSVGDANFGDLEQMIEGWEEGLASTGPHWTQEMLYDDFTGDELGLDTSHAPATGVPAGSDCIVKSYLDILPATCSSAGMTSGGGCSFQIPLSSLVGTADLNLQVAIGTCPTSLLPFISVRIGGAGATSLLAPCSSDAQCGPSHVRRHDTPPPLSVPA
jgi:hypothetical protein